MNIIYIDICTGSDAKKTITVLWNQERARKISYPMGETRIKKIIIFLKTMSMSDQLVEMRLLKLPMIWTQKLGTELY
jgi:hypothetical protein